MDHVAPLGPVYQAGHARGKPAGDEAGIAALKQLAKPGCTRGDDATGAALVFGLRAELQMPESCADQSIGSLSTVLQHGAGKKLRGCQSSYTNDTPNFSAKC